MIGKTLVMTENVMLVNTCAETKKEKEGDIPYSTSFSSQTTINFGYINLLYVEIAK